MTQFEEVKKSLKLVLPEAAWNAARDAAYSIRTLSHRFTRRPPVGWVRFGSLRRVQPIDPNFGFSWGQVIDRYYTEKFLVQHAQDINGRVLEIADDGYTRRFGGDRVQRSDVLHYVEGNPKATLIADLTNALEIPSDTFDTIILTGTLQVIYDMRAAIRTLYRILKPGGVLLATCPGISPISSYDMEHWGEYWRLTSLAARKLFTEVFSEECLSVEAYGNVLSATAFLHGLTAQDLRPEELDYRDPRYEVTIGVRARKQGSDSSR